MSSGDDDGLLVNAAKIVVAGGVLGVMAIRGCVVQADLTPELTPVEVGEDPQHVPGTSFDPDEEPAQVVDLHGDSDADLALQAGLNIIEMTCRSTDGSTYNYDFRGAHGRIEVGQPVNFAGSEDDITVERPNGESLRITNDCPGGKGSEFSKVYINVER